MINTYSVRIRNQDKEGVMKELLERLNNGDNRIILDGEEHGYVSESDGSVELYYKG